MNKNQILLLQFMTFMAFVGMTMVYPLIPTLTTSILASQFFSHLAKQSQIALLMAAYPLGLCLGSLLIGKLSDSYGKKNLFLVTLLLASISQLFSGYAIQIHNYDCFLVARFLSGLFEGNITIARAAIALLSKNEKRKRINFGQTHAAMMLGWTTGPLLGAFLSRSDLCASFTFTTPLYTSAFLTFMLCLFTALRFKEPQQLDEIESSHSQLATALTQKNIFFLLIANFLMVISIDAFYQFLPLYLFSLKTNPTTHISMALSILALSNFVGNTVLIPMISRWLKSLQCVILGSFLLSCGFLLVSTSHFGYGLLGTLTFIGCILAITTTNMMVLVSMKGAARIQGKLMGILLSQRSIGTFIICLAMIPALKYSYRIPFIIGSGLIILSAVITVVQHYLLKKNDASEMATTCQ